MAAPKFQSPFPPLQLSIDEKRELCRKAKRLVGDVVEDYERYLWIDQEKLSPSRWAVVKEREDVRVYHDRRPGAGTDDKDLNEGDLVELIGRHQSPEQVAAAAGTIGYEILTRLGRRFHRRYVS